MPPNSFRHAVDACTGECGTDGSVATDYEDSAPIVHFVGGCLNADECATNIDGGHTIDVFPIHLATELKDTNIKVNSAHPGWVKTALGSDAVPMSVPGERRPQWRLHCWDRIAPTAASSTKSIRNCPGRTFCLRSPKFGWAREKCEHLPSSSERSSDRRAARPI
jgi:hypothetical protein